MRLKLILLLAVISLSASPQQRDGEKGFKLDNSTTYSPGSVVIARFNSRIFYDKDFKFTLFRITDPVSFFNLLAKSSSYIDVIGSGGEALLKYTEEVKTWNQHIITSELYGSSMVSPGKIEDPGIYIIQCTDGEAAAYCCIAVSDYGIITRYYEDSILAYTADFTDGSFMENVNFSCFTDDSVITKKSSHDGMVSFPLSRSAESVTLFAAVKGETLLSDPYYFFSREDPYNAYVYTSQPVYKPGSEVNFKAIIRRRLGNNLINEAESRFHVSVTAPGDVEIFSDTLTTNEFGSLAADVQLFDDAVTGSYTIIIEKDDNRIYGYFEVEEYKKPEYKVSILNLNERYAPGEMINGTVKAEYYFGKPLQNGEAIINVYKKELYRPWYYLSRQKWFYSRFDKLFYASGYLSTRLYGRLDDNGEFRFKYLPHIYDNNDELIFEAEITDAGGSRVKGAEKTIVSQNDYILTVTPEVNYLRPGSSVKLFVRAAGYSGSPLAVPFTLKITRDKDQSEEPIQFITGSTDSLGYSEFNYSLPAGLSGSINCIVTAPGITGDSVTARSGFIAGRLNDFLFPANTDIINIKTEKPNYRSGDSLNAYVLLPDSGVHLLITYESSGLIKYKRIYSPSRSFALSELLGDDYAPSFTISVSYIHNRNLKTQKLIVPVMPVEKLLTVQVISSDIKYSPGGEVEYKIKVTRSDGKPAAKTEVSVAVVDESLFAVRKDKSSLTEFFYRPEPNYVKYTNSVKLNENQASSRPVNAYYDLYNSSSLKRPNGSGSLKGKVSLQSGISYIVISVPEYYYLAKPAYDGSYSFNAVPEGAYTFFAFDSLDREIYYDKITVLRNSVKDIAALPPVEKEDQRAEIRKDITNSVPPPPMKQAYVEPVLRTDFPDNAFWRASVVTDDSGYAAVKFKLPDNLTSWRADVKGITPDSRTGEGYNTIISSKDLLVRLDMPGFFRSGDIVTITAAVHNYLDTAKSAEVGFKAAGLTLLGSRLMQGSAELIAEEDSIFRLVLPSGSETRIEYRLQVTGSGGEALLAARALTDTESDAVEYKVPLLPYGIEQYEDISLRTADTSAVHRFTIPEEAYLENADFKLTASSSLKSVFAKAAGELMRYPYGCAEQITSKLLAASFFSAADLSARVNKQQISKLLNQLYRLRNYSGGWGWMSSGSADPFMSAYAVYGLTRLYDAGFPVSYYDYRQGITHLLSNFSRNDINISVTDELYALFALSEASRGINTGRSPLLRNGRSISSMDEYINRDTLLALTSRFIPDSLNSYSLSLLALSFINLGDSARAKSAVSLLTSRVKSAGQMIYLEDALDDSWHGSSVSTSAYALRVLTELETEPEIREGILNFLLQQKKGLSWRSTKETADVLSAASVYLAETEPARAEFTYNVLLNDSTIAGGKSDTPELEIKIDAALLKTGINEIKVLKEGEGVLYLSGSGNYYENSGDRVEGGLEITRQIMKLKQIYGKVYEARPVEGAVNPGDTILIANYAYGGGKILRYFMLRDMHPSGFEVLSDVNRIRITGEGLDDRYISSSYAHTEHKDAETRYFTDSQLKAMYYDSILRARYPGEYNIMPAQGHLMYFPETLSTGTYDKITISDVN